MVAISLINIISKEKNRKNTSTLSSLSLLFLHACFKSLSICEAAFFQSIISSNIQ